MNIQDHANELAAQCIKRPTDYAHFPDDGRSWFEPNGWGFSPIGTHRDADTLTRSNWEVITADLLKRFPESFQVFHTSHWAVGWYEHLAVNTADDAAMEALAEWVCALADYPVADESHFSELEWNEACDYWARMGISERIDAIERSGSHCSVFAARRAEFPSDDSGSLQQYLNQ